MSNNAASNEDEIEIVIPSESSSSICMDQGGSLKGIGSNNMMRKATPVKISDVSPIINASSSPMEEEQRIRHLELYRAALSGDWEIADAIYKEHPKDVSARISKDKDTALHIAAAAKHSNFVKELVSKMTKGELTMRNVFGNTALCLAAASGNVELAEAMVRKNARLAEIRGSNGMLPLQMAALLGQKKMVDYLYNYKVTSQEVITDKDGIDLLISLINTDLYDVALHLVDNNPKLATARDTSMETALHAFARKSLMSSSSFSSQNQQGSLVKWFNLFSGTNMLHSKKLHPQALTLIKRLWDQVILLGDLEISELIGKPWRLIFVAAEKGNIEFLTILIRAYPDLLVKVDDDSYSIFHISVRNRHEDIFKLIHEIGSIKDLLVASEDSKKNNILHLAAMLAPQNRLNIVSGAALQLQRELLWFKEVNKIVLALSAEAENKEGKTPRDLFTKSHTDLRNQGEKWMKGTAQSCMIVATLIATVVFAAVFTVPGGNNQDSGVPTFLQKLSFKAFAISDAISLVSSSCSILTFLSILTSRYAEEDFLFSLPTKLIVGLATLFLSILAMTVVFCATYFIVFQDGVPSIAIFVTAIAIVPIILFIWQQCRLFIDVVGSTFVSSSMFKSNKRSLFYKLGKTV